MNSLATAKLLPNYVIKTTFITKSYGNFVQTKQTFFVTSVDDSK